MFSPTARLIFRYRHDQTLLIAIVATLISCVASSPSASFAAEPKRPNIVWIIVDDMSANFGCYGEQAIATPHVDRLAREGTLFRHAYVTAPVCSPCRSALITGMYQTSIGAHHHRSGRGVEKIRLPEGVVPVPELLKAAGYYTCIGDGLAAASPGVSASNGGKPQTPRPRSLGKTDYNFEWNAAMYDGPDWSGRTAGQPFFMQVQLQGGKLRLESTESARKLAERAERELGSSTRPDDVTLPPYYPRDPALLVDWAAYLDSVRFTDRHVGEVLARLEREQLLDETLVIFMTDHGISHARGKQFLYDEGTHVPLVIRGPGIARGKVREDLVEHIDLAAITLAAAGLSIPAKMQGKNVFAAEYRPRDAVFAARDRCDETVERLRSVRTNDYLYIRNFYPRRPHLQPNAYKDGKAIVQTLRTLHEKGELSPLAEQLLFAPERPTEELYAWKTDRWQTRNLAGDSKFARPLQELRSRLDQWMTETRDHGPESDAQFDSDMAVYLGEQRRQAPERAEIIQRNIDLMKRWASEGQ